MATDTIREQLRDYRSGSNRDALKLGIAVEDIRREKRGERTVQGQVRTMANESTPLPRRDRIVVDNPVNGSFDGINREFTLSQDVGGAANLAVGVVTAASGTVNFPTRTDHPAPGGGSFWFDGDQTIRIGEGDITDAADRVFAVYPRRA